MDSTGSTASNECTFKDILKTCQKVLESGEKKSLQNPCLLIKLQS